MLRFHVPDMSCGGCAKSVTKALSSVDPQARIDIDLGARQVGVESAAPETDFVAALLEAGYPAEIRREAALG